MIKMNKQQSILMKVIKCKTCRANLHEVKSVCKKHKREWEEYLEIDKASLIAEQRNQRFSENTQHIYRMHPCTKTPYGKRVMTEVGVIKDLRIDTTYNYILIPITGNGKLNAWHIIPLQKQLLDKEKDKVVEDAVIDAIKKADKGEPYDEWSVNK